MELGVASQRIGFRIVNIENGEQFGDRQKVLDLLRQVEQLERPAFFIDSRKARNEFANAARIDVTDAAQVQKDLVLAFTQQTSDRTAKCNAALADRYLAFGSRIVTSPAWRSEILISDIFLSSF